MKRLFIFLLLPLFSLGLAACDSVGGEGQNNDLESNSFKAVVEGTTVDRHDLVGSMAVQGSDWDGSAFIFDVGGRLGDTDMDTSLVFFSLNLSPGVAFGEDIEGINITYLGSEISAGTYDIVAVDDDAGWGGDFEEGVFRADYYKYGGRSDSLLFGGDIEMYPATLGSVTLTEVTTETVEGSFTFEAEICRCFNMDELFQRLMDRIGDGRDGGDRGDWGDPFEDYEIERDLSAEGDFNVDIRRASDFEFEDHGDGDGVRISRTPGQGRGR